MVTVEVLAKDLATMDGYSSTVSANLPDCAKEAVESCIVKCVSVSGI